MEQIALNAFSIARQDGENNVDPCRQFFYFLFLVLRVDEKYSFKRCNFLVT